MVLRVPFESRLLPLNPTAAPIPLPFLFALQPGGDAELGALPEPVDFSCEVFGELGGVDHQQGFVVLMGGAGAPVERAGDHGAVVDHSQLIWLGSKSAVSALILRFSVYR